MDSGKFDRSLALGLALLGHVGLLGFVWDGTGARARSIASEAGDGSTITVDFVAISPRAPTPSLAALAQPVDVAINANTDADADAAGAASTTPMEFPVDEGDQHAAVDGMVSTDEQGRGSASIWGHYRGNKASFRSFPVEMPPWR